MFAKVINFRINGDIVWKNVFLLLTIHLAAIYGVYLKLFCSMYFYTRLFCIFYSHIGAWGITAGRHRYFTHRAFKGNRFVDILLTIMACTAFEQSIYTWARDHRLHHKHSDTNADPYNSRRGFFFCHMGWIMLRKHEDVKEKGKYLDMSDLKSNPIVMFEYKYSVPLAFIFTVLVPTLVPWYFWNESLLISFFYCTLFRYAIVLHSTWSVNSFAHLYGMRTYDKYIEPAENKLVSSITFGEGFHNYHHTFPWDYKAAELSGDFRNLTTFLIDFLAFLGMVTERKTASPEMIEKRKTRTGISTWHATVNNVRSLLIYALYTLVVG